MSFQLHIWRVRIAVELLPKLRFLKREIFIKDRFGIERRLMEKLESKTRQKIN